MYGYVTFVVLVSALAAPASVSAMDHVSANVLGSTAGFALNTGVHPEHEGEPAPASPPPPQPGQASAAFHRTGSIEPLPPPGQPPGPFGVL